MNELVSVIVPVYNVEKYLSKCIDSILNQTYSNLELILVDDGSTDESGRICDEYAAKDDRIRVIHKENGGQGSARNMALDVMTGEFVAFVDSDDYIELNMFEKMVDAAQCYNADVVATSFLMNTPFRQIETETVEKIVIIDGSENLIKEYLTTPYVSGTVCNKLFKSLLWDDIRFPQHRASEDNATTYRIMGRSQRSLILPERFYHYVMREDSTEHNLVIENHFVSVDVAEERYAYISEKYPGLKKPADINRWQIRLAMYDRLFISRMAKKHKTELQKWLSFFREHTAPRQDMEKKRQRILKFPYWYGYSISLKANGRKTIKSILIKLKKALAKNG